MSLDIYAILRKLTDVAVALSAEKDKRKLYELILHSACELTRADGGTLYLVEGDHLNFEIIQNKTLKIDIVAGSDRRFPPIALKEGEKMNDRMVAAYVANHRTTINIADAYTEAGFDFSGTRSFDEKNGYRSKSFLTVALINHEDDVIGVLQLINAKDAEETIVSFTKQDQVVAEALASQTAVSLTNQMLIRGLKEMFESLTRVIAEAIDEKSPITGKHCKRVPIIAHMIAEAAGQADSRYKLTDEQLYELDIAALLHDCGKVTTPVHVVEKGQKLQTIIDRILLIEARLEIILRDKEVAYLKGDKTVDVGQLKEQYKQDMAFLRQANMGTESMSEEALKRIDALSQLTWTNIYGEMVPLISDDEKYNLKIMKGTLTPEERKIIENHAAMTIRMLSQIPYPKYLKDVTEIAGSHHEKINGTGYPRHLRGDQMSDRAKMLAIADVFEALTAPDRPYKEVMPLSKALKILTSMSEEEHIDKNLWQLFLKEKVYLDYGKKYLRPEQLDVS